jgi:proteasome component ECM29
VDDTTASKYRALTESNDGLVFADFCFHTLLYQAPPQGYVFLAKLGKMYRTKF